MRSSRAPGGIETTYLGLAGCGRARDGIERVRLGLDGDGVVEGVRGGLSGGRDGGGSLIKESRRSGGHDLSLTSEGQEGSELEPAGPRQGRAPSLLVTDDHR